MEIIWMDQIKQLQLFAKAHIIWPKYSQIKWTLYPLGKNLQDVGGFSSLPGAARNAREAQEVLT